MTNKEHLEDLRNLLIAMKDIRMKNEINYYEKKESLHLCKVYSQNIDTLEWALKELENYLGGGSDA